MIEIFNTERDDVISSVVGIGRTNYEFALEYLFPLLDRFGEQRRLQPKNFYARLKKDILSGCVMPPITIAFVSRDYSNSFTTKKVLNFVNNNIEEGYILDGMQRLNTLKDASFSAEFELSRPLYVNIIIAEKYDLLLYRMITLNNGQRPMTARHQIEMLTGGAIDLSEAGFKVVTEKDTENTKIKGAFKKSDIVEAYTAYLTNNVNTQNKKIIESKLNDILVGRVMEAELSQEDVSFSEILSEIGRLAINCKAREWLRLSNNLIGFTTGAKRSTSALQDISPENFATLVQKFDDAFGAINPSKVNVGKIRRELSMFFVSNIEEFLDSSVDDIETAFFEQTI